MRWPLKRNPPCWLQKIRKIFGNEARVTRLIKRTTVLLSDVPDWVDRTDIATALGLPSDNPVRLDNRDRTRTVRLLQPIAEIIKLAEAKTAVLTWVRCQFRLLPVPYVIVVVACKKPAAVKTCFCGYG